MNRKRTQIKLQRTNNNVPPVYRIVGIRGDSKILVPKRNGGINAEAERIEYVAGWLSQSEVESIEAHPFTCPYDITYEAYKL